MIAQLQQVDKWLQMKDHQNKEREQEIRCGLVNLYRMTNALLRAENAMTVISVGASIPNPGDEPDDRYLEIVVNRHSKTLTALRKLVNECLPSGNKEGIGDLIEHKERTVKTFMKHGKILQILVGISPSSFSSRLNFSHIVILLQSLGKLLEALENTKEEEKLDRSDKEIIKDVIIWRCILIYLLFSTAPDNSKILTSGLWEHVIPII